MKADETATPLHIGLEIGADRGRPLDDVETMVAAVEVAEDDVIAREARAPARPVGLGRAARRAGRDIDAKASAVLQKAFEHRRSEEHTSDIQSLMRRSYDVFCLEQKKTTQT